MEFNNNLKYVVNKALKTGSVPMLIGEPGIGKSSWLNALAEENGTKCFTLECNQLADKADLTGARLVPYKKADGSESFKQVFYPHAIVTEAIDYAEEHPEENPILFLDEMNRTTSDITSAALSIPTTRTIGSARLPENLKIVMAGNDKGNVNTLDTASISRFLLLRVEPDVETFIELQDLHKYIKMTLLNKPKTLLTFANQSIFTEVSKQTDEDDDYMDINSINDMLDGDEMLQFSTPRTISALNRWFNDVEDTNYMEFKELAENVSNKGISMLDEVIKGFVGNTPFAEELSKVIKADKRLKGPASGASTPTAKLPAFNIEKPEMYDLFIKDGINVDYIIDECDELKAQGTADEVLGNILAYAIQDKSDNSKYIKIIAPQIDTLSTEANRTIMIVLTNGLTNKKSMQVLLKYLKTDIADVIKSFMEQLNVDID